MNTAVSGRRVLVVEDDYFVAEDLAETLRQAGAEIIGPVGSVHDALAALDPAPDVVTLDVRLGDELSFPVADALTRRAIPFIFSTGSGDEIPAAHKARPVCQKPVSEAVILQALAEALASG